MSTRRLVWCGFLLLVVFAAAKYLSARNNSHSAGAIPNPKHGTPLAVEEKMPAPAGFQHAGAGPALDSPAILTTAVGGRTEREEQEEDWGTLFPMAQVLFKKDPFLAKFGYYYKHVLLNREGRLQYEKLLADPKVHRQVRQQILFPEERQETTEDALRRHLELGYLKEALSWPENPQRQTLLTMLADMVVEDNFRSEQSPGLRMSLAGDKLELFAILAEQNPELARALTARARGTRLEGLLVYTADYVARQQGDQPTKVMQLAPGN